MKNNLKNVANYKYLETVLDLNNKRTIEFTYLALTIVALIFFGLVAINPTLSTIANLQKQLSDSQFVEAQLQKKIENLSALQTSYSALQSDLPTVNSAIPISPQAPTLIGQIEAVGTNSGISILSAQVFPVELDGKQTKKSNNFNIAVLAEGSNDQINTFVNNLSLMERIISLDQITISKKVDKSGLSQISVRGTAFFKK